VRKLSQLQSGWSAGMQRTVSTLWESSEQPTLFWRLSDQREFHSLNVARSSDGWHHFDLEAEADQTIVCYLAGGSARFPEVGHYKFRTRHAFLQRGEVFHYMPAPEVEGPLRDYEANAPQEIHSEILKESRKVRVYLPRGYRQHGERRYPVLYIQDGQNIFERGAYGSWQAHLKIDRLIARGEIEEVIVVAVDHGVGRFQDYVPPEDGGKAHRYAAFLVNELKPWVDLTYRTRPGPQDTAIMGSSLGGLAAFYIAWNYSYVFGKVASLSGSWWLRRFRDRLAVQRRRKLKVYLDSGDSGPSRDCVQHSRTLHEILVRLGYEAGSQLRYRVAHRHTHTESAWGERTVQAMRFLFPISNKTVAA
jgi:predicted alpha/beta superfamily hydrolase